MRFRMLAVMRHGRRRPAIHALAVAVSAKGVDGDPEPVPGLVPGSRRDGKAPAAPIFVHRVPAGGPADCFEDSAAGTGEHRLGWGVIHRRGRRRPGGTVWSRFRTCRARHVIPTGSKVDPCGDGMLVDISLI